MLDRTRRLRCLAVALLAACASDGSDTPTADFVPAFSIIGSGASVQVFARLSTEDFPSVRLSNDDALRVTAGTQSRQLEFAVDPFNAEYYTTQLGAVDADAPVTFSLERADGDDAPNSTVGMPFPATLSQPSSNALFFVGDAMEVAWQQFAGGDVVTVVLEPLDCPGTTYHETLTGDPGSVTITIPASLLPNVPILGSCTIAVRIERQRNGTLDPAFRNGGSIFARRFDSRNVNVAQAE